MGQIRILNREEMITALKRKLHSKTRLSILCLSLFLMFEIAIFERNPLKIIGFALIVLGIYKITDYKLVERELSKERKKLLAVLD